VLALPPAARIFAPAAWGWVADRTGAHRAIVVFSCAVTAAAFAALHFTSHIALVIGVMSVLSAGALPIGFEIGAGSLEEAAEKFGPLAKEAIERTVKELQELRRQAASSIVVPQGGMPPMGGLGGGGKIQMP